VPDVLDLVERTLLEQAPPRRLPPFFLPNLVGEYLLERPLRTYFDPYVLLAICALGLSLIVQAPTIFSLLLVALLALRLIRPVWRLCRDVREDYLLLRHGVVVSAHVLGVRPCRDSAGNQAGAYLDCAIPITRKRTSVGSVWMPDASDALRVSSAGRLPVICLARAPGAWRLRDGDGPHLRYEPARQ
jgi:hypothetical protein